MIGPYLAICGAMCGAAGVGLGIAAGNTSAAVWAGNAVMWALCYAYAQARR